MNSTTPLVLLLVVFKNNNINDMNKLLFIKFFFKHHINLTLEYNLIDIYLEINNIEDYPLTYNIIIDFYSILSKQINNINLIKKFKSCYKNSFFWKKNIEEQIIYLKKLHEQLLSIFDGSKTSSYFHLKLKGNNMNSLMESNISGKNYHIEQIMERLKKTVSLFKLNFFKEHNIYLVSNFQFIDLTFDNMIKYTEYVFNKLNDNLIKYITYFEHYNHYRNELINLFFVSELIDIDIDINVDSDIDIDDINFFSI